MTLETPSCILPRPIAKDIADRLQELQHYMPGEDPRIYIFARQLGLDLCFGDYITSSGALASAVITQFQKRYGHLFPRSREASRDGTVTFLDTFLPRLTQAVCPPDVAQQVVSWYNSIYHPAPEKK